MIDLKVLHVHYSLYIFGVINEICIDNVMKPLKESQENFELWIEAFEIKDLTCDSESNGDADDKVLKSIRENHGKIYGEMC